MKYILIGLISILFFNCDRGKRYHDKATNESSSSVNPYYKDHTIAGIRSYRNEMNKRFKNPDVSPLSAQDIGIFTSLDFFPIDTSYVVKATFSRTPDEKPFSMPMTDGSSSSMVKYGEVTFKINNEASKLSIYEFLDLNLFRGTTKYLFLPFNDLTNGDESYGGGRYINLPFPNGDIIEVDFNKSYNPYCAYNPNYTCPIVPRENFLNTKVLAGIKNYKK